MLRLLQVQRRQPLLIAQLARENLVIRALGLSVHGVEDAQFLSPADLSELRDAWASFSILDDFENALRMERAIERQHFHILVTNRARRMEAFGWADKSREMMDLEPEPAWHHVWRTWAQEPLWPWLWADHDMAWSLNHWNHRIDAARRARTRSWEDAAFDISALDVRSGFLKDVPMGRFVKVRVRRARHRHAFEPPFVRQGLGTGHGAAIDRDVTRADEPVRGLLHDRGRRTRCRARRRDDRWPPHRR